MITCFFIGHRDAPKEIRPRLMEAIERHITEYGVTEFVVGHYGAFDRMAAHAVRDAKERHPDVCLILLLPYFPYEHMADKYDGSYYPPGVEKVPKPFAIVKANEHMIQSSEYLICYNKGYVGKTRDFVEMALRREKTGLTRVENLALRETESLEANKTVSDRMVGNLVSGNTDSIAAHILPAYFPPDFVSKSKVFPGVLTFIRRKIHSASCAPQDALFKKQGY